MLLINLFFVGICVLKQEKVFHFSCELLFCLGFLL